MSCLLCSGSFQIPCLGIKYCTRRVSFIVHFLCVDAGFVSEVHEVFFSGDCLPFKEVPVTEALCASAVRCEFTFLYTGM